MSEKDKDEGGAVIKVLRSREDIMRELMGGAMPVIDITRGAKQIDKEDNPEGTK